MGLGGLGVGPGCGGIGPGRPDEKGRAILNRAGKGDHVEDADAGSRLQPVVQQDQDGEGQNRQAAGPEPVSVQGGFGDTHGVLRPGFY